ncbi:hypothetical protein HKX48_008219 [Thoreauomyces humboldtii]|nr:hypothetical protein HKX48_008219 [Thoreauomyces humboldtii]
MGSGKKNCRAKADNLRLADNVEADIKLGKKKTKEATLLARLVDCCGVHSSDKLLDHVHNLVARDKVLEAKTAQLNAADDMLRADLDEALAELALKTSLQLQMSTST